MHPKRRTNILVCPFGDLNLVLFLCQKLEEKFPGKYAPTFLSFTAYDDVVYRSRACDHVHIHPGLRDEWFSAADLEDVCRFTIGLSHYHGTLAPDGYYHSVANHYGARISELLESREYEHVVLFNGRMNLFIACLDKIAENAGVPRLIFEQGLFRPRCITIDGQGVNARNSIQSLDQLLSNEPFDYQQRELYRDLVTLFPVDRKWIPDSKRAVPIWGLLCSYGASRLRPGRDIFLRNAENRDLLESVLFPRRAKTFGRSVKTLDEICDDGDHYFIFCPFQVETDTQIILHSPWISRMAEFVEVMCNVAERLNRQRIPVRVLFKRHPMSSVRVRASHPDVDFIEDVPMSEVFQRLKPLVVTINSTAGIEAIDAGLPVVTLGEAFFNLPGVIVGSCRDADSLTELLSRHFHGDAKQDTALGARFIKTLREKYQVLAYSESSS